MSFTHKDFYHSPSTLRRVSSHLKSEGFINDKEKKYIDECIYMNGSSKMPTAEETKNNSEANRIELKQASFNDQPRAARLKMSVNDLTPTVNLSPRKNKFGTYDNYKVSKVRQKASDVVVALGKYVASNTKNQKLECVADVVAAVHGGIMPSKRALTPARRSGRKSSRPPCADPSKVVIYFADLRDSEKEKYLSFLVENNVRFCRSGTTDKLFTATIRLEPSKPAVTESAKKKKKKVKTTRKNQNQAASRLTSGKSAFIYSRHTARPPQELARIATAMAEGPFDLTTYPKFSSLITLREHLKPRKRPLSWLMRHIEEIYDSRFIHDSADFKDDGTVVDKGERLSNQFPIFVVDFFSKRYGLRNLVDQTCWDMLLNIDIKRKNLLEVEIFARFLEEFYDPDDLLFFLYVRSVIQKEIGINFRNRWSELGRKREQLRDTIWLSYSSCIKVSRVVFVSESDPLFRAFMDMIEQRDPQSGQYRHLVGAVTRKSDTRRIEVIQFLHLALAEYHETRPAEGEALAAAQVASAEAEAGDDSGGVGGRILVRSKEEQHRLYKEAEAQFEQSQQQKANTAAGIAGDGTAMVTAESPPDEARAKRIKELEDRIRAEIKKRREDNGGAGSAYADDGTDATDTMAATTMATRTPIMNNADVQTRTRTETVPAHIADDKEMMDKYEKALRAQDGGVEGAAAQSASPPAFYEDGGGGEIEDDNSKLIGAISKTIDECNAAFLEELMQSCEYMAPEIFEEIYREVKQQLDQKVEEMLNEVVDADLSGQWDSDEMDDLVPKFRACRETDGPDFADTVRVFCDSVVGSRSVRGEIGELANVLKTYAEGNPGQGPEAEEGAEIYNEQ